MPSSIHQFVAASWCDAADRLARASKLDEALDEALLYASPIKRILSV